MNLETASTNFGNIDEAVEAATVPNVLRAGSRGAPVDMDVDSSANPH